MRIRDLFHFSVEIPDKTQKRYSIMHNPNDFYVALEINHDGVKQSEPLGLEALTIWITDRYKDQPLQYFNEHRRIKIVHLKTGDVKVAKLTIDFTT